MSVYWFLTEGIGPVHVAGAANLCKLDKIKHAKGLGGIDVLCKSRSPSWAQAQDHDQGYSESVDVVLNLR